MHSTLENPEVCRGWDRGRDRDPYYVDCNRVVSKYEMSRRFRRSLKLREG